LPVDSPVSATKCGGRSFRTRGTPAGPSHWRADRDTTTGRRTSLGDSAPLLARPRTSAERASSAATLRATLKRLAIREAVFEPFEPALLEFCAHDTLERVHEIAILARDQSERLAGPGGPTGTTDAVCVAIGGVGCVELMTCDTSEMSMPRATMSVATSTWNRPPRKLRARAPALVLREVALQRGRATALRDELTSERLRPMLGAGEDDRRLHLRAAQQLAEERRLAAVGDRIEMRARPCRRARPRRPRWWSDRAAPRGRVAALRPASSPRKASSAASS